MPGTQDIIDTKHDDTEQEAEAAGYTNYFEITARESLDQVRVVFNEGIRRGLACGEHRRGLGRRVRRSFSTDQDLRETSPECEESLSPKTTVNLPSHIICHIKRRLISKITLRLRICYDLMKNNFRSQNFRTETKL